MVHMKPKKTWMNIQNDKNSVSNKLRTIERRLWGKTWVSFSFQACPGTFFAGVAVGTPSFSCVAGTWTGSLVGEADIVRVVELQAGGKGTEAVVCESLFKYGEFTYKGTFPHCRRPKIGNRSNKGSDNTYGFGWLRSSGYGYGTHPVGYPSTQLSRPSQF